MRQAGDRRLTPPEDRRFPRQAWNDSALFDFIKQSYLLSARSILGAVKNVEGLDDHTARKVDFYTRQYVDAMAPSNFILTNPEVLRATIESGGENLVNGLKNLLDDLDRGKGRLAISMTDPTAFKIGENVAATPGKVVYQNDLMQLIQYAPTTEKVKRRPLLIIPPGSTSSTSSICGRGTRSSVGRSEQGHTVFVISWVNPDERLARNRSTTTCSKGRSPRSTRCGRRPANATQTSSAIASADIALGDAGLYGGKARHKDQERDLFRDDGRLHRGRRVVGVIDEEQLTALEERMNKKGYLEARDMHTTFNMLRANDLIWSFVVNNYLLGKSPFPFDLLYWNSDSTRMPAAMHSFYLRKMYQENLLAKPGGITLGGVPIDLRKVKTPAFLLSTREDHIAPWRSTYAATQLFSGRSSTCSQRPATSPESSTRQAANMVIGARGKPANPDEWRAGATQRTDSWWPLWEKWVAKYAGGTVPARQPGDGKLTPIEDAPGSYVKVRGEE